MFPDSRSITGVLFGSFQKSFQENFWLKPQNQFIGGVTFYFSYPGSQSSYLAELLSLRLRSFAK